MKIEKFIHPYFMSLSPFISNLAGSFGRNGSIMHTGRNEVRFVELDNYKIVVKSYIKITWINRIIYGFFRKSKAQRAYENAEVLMANDIPTPMPVAFIDSYRFGILQKSFFISLYVNCRSARELFTHKEADSNNALMQFTRFTHKLHRLGIYHADYTLNNVLYSSVEDNYIFYLIDNNRIRFRKYSKGRAMRNLRRINMPLDQYVLLAMEYSRLEQSDAYETAQKMLSYIQVRKIFISYKRGLKKNIKRIFIGSHEEVNVVR